MAIAISGYTIAISGYTLRAPPGRAIASLRPVGEGRLPAN